MKEFQVKNTTGSPVGRVAVPELLCEGAINTDVMHQVVVAHRANCRQGTAKTKTRGEVSGSNRKLFRQKGLGRARMGDIRSPIRVHGGTIFGPQPRSYRQNTPKKMKRLALLSSVRDKFQNGNVLVVESIAVEGDRPRTKAIVQLLKGLGVETRKVLLVLPAVDDQVVLSARNIPRVSVTTSGFLHTYEVLAHQILVTVPAALDALAERLGVGDAESAEAS